MIPMTVKEFDSLCKRDFENGAVKDSIRTALKERESPLTPIPEDKLNGIAEKWLEEYWCEDWCDPSYYKKIKEWLIKFFKEAYDELKERGE